MVCRSFVRVLALTTVVSGCTRLSVSSIPSWQVSNKANPSARQTSPTANPSASSDKNLPEIEFHDEPTTFRVNVKLVLVRVGVWDRDGHAVGSIHKEDFQILDNGKAEVITEFSTEGQAEKVEAKTEPPSVERSVGPTVPKQQVPTIPERYIAYLFDDVHLKFGDLDRARAAAGRTIASSARKNRFAIFSTSGKTMLDFTDDEIRLRAALEALRSHPTHLDDELKCPDLNLYMADLIVNKHDPEATQAAANEVINCYTGPNPHGFVEEAAARVLAVGEQEGRVVVSAINNTVRRLSAMPGDRSIVLVSPGFLIPGLEYDNDDVINTALRAQVIINAIDARGLYVVPSLNPDKGFGAGVDSSGGLATPASRAQLEQQAADRQKDVLAVLANNTGGRFFFNSNDMDEGFRRLAGAPEYSYVLGFVPQDLKADGKYHKLKVKLRTKKRLKLEAREGYFAPKRVDDPAQQASQELEEAMFSRDELRGLPVDFETQSEIAQDTAKLSVLTHVDIKLLHFKKSEGRNCDLLRVAALIFDRSGNYLQGTEKTVTMQLKDETIEHTFASGMTLKTTFDVKPGSYLVRVVARDEESHLMFAKNGRVEVAATPAPPVTSLSASSPKERAPDELRTGTAKDVMSNGGEIESNPWAKARPYLEEPFPNLRANVPELKGLAPATSQDQLTYILDRAGEKCIDLLSRIPNVIAREEVISLVPTPPRMGVSLEPYIGIQRETFEYLVLSEHAASGIKLEEYRMVHGRPATASPALGELSQGFTSEWLRLYPGNRSESRFRYLGQQMMDQHHAFVLGFAQIPELVRFPARFQLPEKEVAIFLQGVMWIDSTDFRILRMREDLLAPRPDIGLKKFTTTIRFGEVNMAKAGSSLWLPQEVVIEWEFKTQTVQRRHRYSDYHLYVAKAKILPATP